jgi:hypothetical protein
MQRAGLLLSREGCTGQPWGMACMYILGTVPTKATKLGSLFTTQLLCLRGLRGLNPRLPLLGCGLAPSQGWTEPAANHIPGSSHCVI